MSKHGLNARIARYFIEHSRITLIAFLALTTFGVISLLALKTSGFPSPEINIVTVSTVYPGASSGTVLEEITKPIESQIKEIDGVTTYSSQSLDNFSVVVINLDEDKNSDSIKSKIDTVVGSVKLPINAEDPEVAEPPVSTDEYIYAIAPKSDDIQDAYRAFSILKKEIERNPNVVAINPSGGLEERVVISVDKSKLEDSGITIEDVSSSLQSWGLVVPTAENATFGDKNYNVVLSIDGESLDELRQINIVNQISLSVVQLGDVASVSSVFVQPEMADDIIGYKLANKVNVKKAIVFGVDISSEADLKEYDSKLQSLLKKYFNQGSRAHEKLSVEDKALFDKVSLVEVYNTNNDNERQINEVLAGLFGEKWGIPLIGWIGFAFGAIQLVFIFMMLLVSWRAAIIAAVAIPLSFFFSTITLLVTGNDLNTLTLFSLVLVIGLVVDPAIVVLEVIQRYIDKGLKGTKAILAAIDDIGYGLFIAVFTSMLVFIPFGVVSGIFGSIIAYIPLTILPALVGSYIVPLVFLSSLGSVILKRRPGQTKNEEHNLWRSARWMIRANLKLLNMKAWQKFGVIVLSLVIPLAVAFVFIGSGQVKMVQFSQPNDSDFLQMVVIKKPQQSTIAADRSARTLIAELLERKEVVSVAPVYANSSNSLNYSIKLDDPSERFGKSASLLAKELNELLDKSSADDGYFDVNINAAGPGPPNAIFPVSIGIKNPDPEIQRKVAIDISTILDKICNKDGKVEIASECQSKNKIVLKIDNGLGSQVNNFVEIRLRRDKLLFNPVNPISLRERIASIYSYNRGNELAKLRRGSEELPIYLEKNNDKPDTVDEIGNLPINTLSGGMVLLSDIAYVSEVESPSTIRQVEGEAVGVVSAKVRPEFADQAKAATIQQLVIDEFNRDYQDNYNDVVVEGYSEGDVASIAKSFNELGIALILAILLTYVVMAIFFNSLSMPVVILFSIPLTFLGIFPGLGLFGGGQLGFLEIIGIIILVGLVENVAIFLIDAANRKEKEGLTSKQAIAYASGVRFRPIILTKVMAIASLAPLAVLSEFYRSLSVVIIFGLLTSGALSLFVTPILYVFFRELSHKVRLRIFHKEN